MALTSIPSSISYVGNNSNVTPYPIPYSFRSNSHVILYIDGEIAVMGYTVTGEGLPEGDPSSQLVTDDPVPATSTVTIARETPNTQETELEEGDSLPAAVLEGGLDNPILQIQEITETISRIPKSRPGIDPPGGNLEQEASTTIGQDADGNFENRTATEQIAHLGLQSKFDQATADAASAAASAATATEGANAAARITEMFEDSYYKLVTFTLEDGQTYVRGTLNLDHPTTGTVQTFFFDLSGALPSYGRVSRSGLGLGDGQFTPTEAAQAFAELVNGPANLYSTRLPQDATGNPYYEAIVDGAEVKLVRRLSAPDDEDLLVTASLELATIGGGDEFDNRAALPPLFIRANQDDDFDPTLPKFLDQLNSTTDRAGKKVVLVDPSEGDEVLIDAEELGDKIEELSQYDRLTLRKKLFIKTDGDREAETYGENHSLEDEAVGRVANFLTGLESIGIKSDFYDAGFYASKFQPGLALTAYSLLGLSDLAVTGSPTRKKHGWLIGNDDPSSPSTPTRLYGDVVSAGQWTWVTSDARPKYNGTVGQRRSFNALTTSPYSAFIQMQNGTNWQSYTFAGGSAASINGAKSPVEDEYKPIITTNSTAGSLQTKAFGAGSWLTATGRGNVPLQKLSVGAGTTNGSSFSQYYDGLASYWMLFNSVLSDSALDELQILIEETTMPKTRFVFEGDSISSDTNGWAYHVLSDPDLLGCNIDLVSQGTGGYATPQLVARIGDPAGINDSQSSDDFNVIAVIQAGTNDPGQAPDSSNTYTSGAVETHANLRLLWEAARSRGMKVVACTMPKATIYDAGGSAEYWTTGTSGALSLDVVDQINTLIRNDADRFDYLLDVDQILAGEFGATYWQDTNCFADGIHPGTSQASAGPPVIAALSTLIDSEII